MSAGTDASMGIPRSWASGGRIIMIGSCVGEGVLIPGTAFVAGPESSHINGAKPDSRRRHQRLTASA